MPFTHIKKHPLKFSTLVLIILMTGAAIFLPWKVWVESKISELLAQNGFADSSVTLSHLGLSSVHLDNLRLAKDAPPLFNSLKLDYALSDILQGRMQNLKFSGLNLELQQQTDGWHINGALLKNAAATTAAQPIKLPVTAQELATLPLDALELSESTLHITTDAWRFDAPVKITYQKLPAPSFTAELLNPEFKVSGVTLHATNVIATITLNEAEKKWSGTWKMNSIETRAGEITVPTLNGSGTIEAFADNAALAGTIQSADKKTHGAFNLKYPLNTPEKAQLRLTSAALPWNKGILSVKDAVIPLAGKQDMHANLNVEHVPVDALMMMLTGKETIATGDVSGSVPITIKSNGQLVVGQGKLQTEKPGVITLSPETIPGDNEQIALVRDVMKNLHYNVLSITTESTKDRKLSILMAVEGNNPDVAGGRPVKLNVHLTGDVLNMIQQSLLSLIDPNMYLKQDPHAKP